MISREQLEVFERYANDLLYWNEKVNLISRRDIEHIWLRHILHSVAMTFTGELPKWGKVIDIGTGGGLPGIPLKILNPKFDMTLVDSIAKKVQTVGMMASHITKHGLRAVRTRAEELPNDPKLKGPYDLVVSRATAPLVDLMKWSQPILATTGRLLTLKGGDLTEEIRQAQTKFKDAEIAIFDLKVRGTSWFSDEEKRLVRVTWPGAGPVERENRQGEPAAGEDAENIL